MPGLKIARGRMPAKTNEAALACLLLSLCFGARRLIAQTQPQVSNRAATPAAAENAFASASPIAIVPVDSTKPDDAALVTGALEVTAGKAMIATSGSVTSGARTTDVMLPRRGTLRVCASTTVKLAADTSVPAGGLPGLLMAMDHGAVEMSFATTPAGGNADVLMTPDFRILIGGPGASEVKVRLGSAGDTCVDNSGGLALDAGGAPYVVVQSLFEGGLYRVQPGQRVMFQHGSLREVVDNEKEPCGCPSPVKTLGNEFPLAQSEGLAPTPAPAVPEPNAPKQIAAPQTPPLIYSSREQAPAAAVVPNSTPALAASAAASHSGAGPVPAKPSDKKKKRNPFVRFGRFLRRVFGGE